MSCPVAVRLYRRGSRLLRAPAGDRYLWWPVASPDGKLLAVSSWRGYAGDDKAIHLFDVQSGKEIKQLTPDDGGVPIGFTPDGRSLLAAARRLACPA